MRFRHPPRLLGPAMGALLALALPAALRAQHAPGLVPRAGAAEAPEAGDCGLCHGSHAEGGQAGYGLRTDDVPGLALQAPGLGRASLSCLRCHSTPGLRSRQPEFAGRPPAAKAGAFLSLDLADDHPVGRIRGDGLVSTGDRPRPGGLGPAGRRMSLRAIGPGATAEIQCTTCHDPHERTASLPSAETQRRLCGACHEPARYSLRRHAELACSDCHALHGGADERLLREGGEEPLCRSCHDGAARPRGGIARTIAPRIDPGHGASGGGSCLTCHPAHD